MAKDKVKGLPGLLSPITGLQRGRDLWPSLRLQGPAEAGFGLGIPKNVVEDPWSIKIGRHLPVLAS